MASWPFPEATEVEAGFNPRVIWSDFIGPEATPAIRAISFRGPPPRVARDPRLARCGCRAWFLSAGLAGAATLAVSCGAPADVDVGASVSVTRGLTTSALAAPNTATPAPDTVREVATAGPSTSSIASAPPMYCQVFVDDYAQSLRDEDDFTHGTIPLGGSTLHSGQEFRIRFEQTQSANAPTEIAGDWEALQGMHARSMLGSMSPEDFDVLPVVQHRIATWLANNCGIVQDPESL